MGFFVWSMDDSRAQDDYVAGLMNVLMPAVEETDNRVRALFEAQELLQKEIHRLSRELETFVETAQVPGLTAYPRNWQPPSNGWTTSMRFYTEFKSALQELRKITSSVAVQLWVTRAGKSFPWNR